MSTIRLAHGGGGRETNELLSSLVRRHLGNPILDKMEDGAKLTVGNDIVFTTDSFVVKPLFFPGADIGKLAVCGTVNDLAVMGAIPRYISLALIIEEGFEIAELDKILESIASISKQSDVSVVCGDTKVVERGAADKIFINTSGIGALRPGTDFSAANIEPGDTLLVSGPVGDHGVAILSARNQFNFAAGVESDCASLLPLVDALIASGCEIHALRDATRGGLAAVLNEWGMASKVTTLLDEPAVPVRESVRSACELLGFSPLDLANEGKLVVAVSGRDGAKALAALRGLRLGAEAAIIGTVEPAGRFPAIRKTAVGSRVIMEMPRGELLPRIC